MAQKGFYPDSSPLAGRLRHLSDTAKEAPVVQRTMHTKRSSLAFVVLLLLSMTPLQPQGADTPSSELDNDAPLFEGFLLGEGGSPWNETPWRNVAVPGGFSYGSVIDYSDVGVLINNLSAESRTIGWAFVAARNISLDRVFIFNETGTPTGETVNRNQFTSFFALPFLEMLQNRSSSNALNYLVTTKGMPLRVSGGNDKASFDQELALLGGSYNASIGSNYWFNHDYGPLAGKAMEPFTRDKYGFFLVTRLTGYTVDTALELIERANQSLGQRGTFVLDLATNRNGSGYKFWNDDLYTANTTLNESMGLPVLFDEETGFITNISNVMGYASWGSNDGNWNQNFLSNGGFDTLDATWQSGSRYWNHSGPTVAADDFFAWNYQTGTKQGGNGAFEATVATACEQDAGAMMQGIYGEYFDNDGVSFNAASMPSLIDREPDRVQVEPHLNHGASNNAYPGLDDRFKQHWGARFSGLIDVPFSGNWSFFINSDDGSELWINGNSVVQNYGMHGMVERSGFLNLSAGLHDFRIEFFQGGGPHGLVFSWQGPNTSKAAVPSSAFYVDGNVVPQADRLVHRWSLEDASGSTANNSVNLSANLTLTGMDASNWRTCVDGGCLWFDGVNDLASVDVADWAGNLSVSQWVWANTSNQSTYASTFAVNDQAGSNLSFQHMISNHEWKLHNNQTHLFGDVTPQRWTHLVSVFDNGQIRQYMDGVLVNTHTYPNGTFTNIDLYKLGVNRAGSAFFEGMIDEVRVWDIALNDHDITSLRRTIVDNCTTYSGGGNDVAHLTTTFTVPEHLKGHAWIGYVYGKRGGEVNGAFGLELTAVDGNGQTLSTNASSMKTFTTSWAAQSVRFRPDANATQFEVRVPVDIASTSTNGEFYLDTVLLRAIRPHMQWTNGSIADTAVSTGGRSFNWGTAYGQSLIADLLEDGVSGVKGYVYEPYLTAVGLPSVYLSSYASGYNLAESHAAANRLSGWMGVVVGDPKMAPYADIFHDISIVDVRVVGPANLGEDTVVQMLIENRGMSSSNGTLMVKTVQGNSILNQTVLRLPPGDQAGSRTLVNLTVVPPSSGYLDLRVRYDNESEERNFANNLYPFSMVVNAPPAIQDVYCSASVVTRGAYTICSVQATDDVNVTDAVVEWQIVQSNATWNESNWTTVFLGQINPTTWEASLVVPANASLGTVVMRATVHDAGGMTAKVLVENVTRVADAPPTWYGPHVAGVDPADWNKASPLGNRPAGGMYRHLETALTACVQDADYRLDEGVPLFLASRGEVGEIAYAPQPTAHVYCYTASYNLSLGSALSDVAFEVRAPTGSLLLQRTVRVNDMPPQLEMRIQNDQGETLDRVVGNGKEHLRVTVRDVDDPGTPFVGDVKIQWPGGQPIQLPLDIPAGTNATVVHLERVDLPLETGNLLIEASGRGEHGGTSLVQLELPFFLTPPEILVVEACDANGPVANMTFGQVALLHVGIVSDRPLDGASAQLTQSGWAINAPATEDLPWDEGEAPEACDRTPYEGQDILWLGFRLKLDNSMVDGEGKAVLSVTDIDGLVKSTSLSLLFQHAPTEFVEVTHSEPLPETDLFTNLTVSDLDGLDRVICAYNLFDTTSNLLSQSAMAAGPEGVFTNQLRWQYPIPRSLANTTLTVNITCVDDLQQAFVHETQLTVGPAQTCLSCSASGNETQVPAAEVESDGVQKTALGLIVAIFAVLGTLLLLRRNGRADNETAWGETDPLNMASLEDLFEGVEDEAVFGSGDDPPPRPTFVPDGWTVEEFKRWLDGPVPEGWTAEQWSVYGQENRTLLAQTTHESQE
jgi:uncharacterized protein (TIGR03790 family)